MLCVCPPACCAACPIAPSSTWGKGVQRRMKYASYQEYAEHVGTLVARGPSWPPTTARCQTMGQKHIHSLHRVSTHHCQQSLPVVLHGKALYSMALSNGRHFIAWRSPMGATLLLGALQSAPLYCMALSNGRHFIALHHFIAWRSPMGPTLLHGALQWASLNCMALFNGRHFVAWRSPMAST